MTTLCVDVPYNYTATSTSVILFSSNTEILPAQKTRVRLPNHLLGRKLKLKNYAYAVSTDLTLTTPVGTIGYFKLQLSFGSRTASNSYVITHSYLQPSTLDPSVVIEEAIALPFSTTQTEFNGCWSYIQLPSTAETEMFIDVSVPTQVAATDYGFKYLTLWFDVL